ncbi:MAG: DNA polymerase III subunit gamma/tau [bacterium]|nr:DNA polymerase III subunit gamma/tau [bacterium]
MSQTLYRKYRPQKFAELSGQQHVKITLQNELLSGTVAHAYLFSGPRGVGKTTTARLLAKALHCLARKPSQSEPCGTCDACLEIQQGRSLDLIEIDAASHTGVDNVRDNIIENARFSPASRSHKVFIIDEAHMLSLAAFNALLKTLEEPPDHVVFILCTTEVHRLPETIISRCQRFDFKKIGQADLEKRLKGITSAEKISVDDEVLKNIARRAEGSSRDAESLLGQVLTLGGKKITAEMAELILPRSNLEAIATLFGFLAERKAGQALDLINALSEEGVNFSQFTKDLIEFLRKILLLKVNGRLDIFSSLELTQEMEKSALDQAETIELNRLVAAINIFLDKEREIKYSDIPQLPLELAIVEICGDSDSSVEIQPPSDSSSATSAGNLGAVSPAAKKPKTSSSTAAAVLEIDEIRKRWNDVQEQFQKANPSLGLTLRLSEPVSIEGNRLVLRCGYAIHAERIESQTVRDQIQKIMANIYGVALTVTTVVETTPLKEKKEGGANTLNPILESFGGEVVG